MAIERSIQKKVNRGFGKAAQRLAHPFIQFRPRSAIDPLANINAYGTLNLGFDHAADFSFTAPLVYKNAIYYGLVNLDSVQIGDYFYDYDQYTFFIANQEPLKPALLVRCNRIVSVLRPTARRASNARNYGGDTQPQTILSNWPAAIIGTGISGPNVTSTGLTGAGQQDLPGAVNDQGVEIYLPYHLQLEPYDNIYDELHRRYTIGQVEQTGLGYRLVCRFVGVTG